MGAAAKCDPTRIQISDISYTMYDPLARSVRRRLRLLGVSSGIPVVYSTEVPGEVKLLPLAPDEFEKGNVKELSAFDDFRVRILPVLGMFSTSHTIGPFPSDIFCILITIVILIHRTPARYFWPPYSNVHRLRFGREADPEPACGSLQEEAL